jgi:hypothetical protein
MMFVDNNFARSNLYFGSLQLLRVFSDWIEDSQADFQQLFEDSVKFLNFDDWKDKREKEDKMEIDKAALISSLEKTVDEQKSSSKLCLTGLRRNRTRLKVSRMGLVCKLFSLAATSVRVLPSKHLN